MAAAIALTSVIAPTAAGAATDPVTKIKTGIICEVQANESGFNISWDLAGTADVDRVIIERNVSTTFHWRGRASPDQTSFVDGAAPRSMGKTDYRVVAKNAAGSAIESSDCELVPTVALHCVVTRGADGYHLDIDADELTAGLDGRIDFVIRRNVSPDRPWYWRGRTIDSSFDDASAHQPFLLYQVWARANGQIIGATHCRNELADPACVTPIEENEIASLSRDIFGDGIGMEPLIDSLNALIPEQQISFVIVDAHDRIIYSRDHEGLADIYIYDPADGSNRLVGESIGELAHTWGYYADIAGGVYVETFGQDDHHYWYYRPDGTVQPLVTSTTDGSDFFPAGELDDGRTVFNRVGWPLDAWSQGPAFHRIIVRSPGTDEFVAVTELEGSRVRSVSTSGDLIVENYRSATYRYFLYDADCIGT